MTPEASDPPLDVTVIVPVHNGGADLSRCIDAIRAATGDSSELILVDDASSDGAVELARKSRPWIRVLRTGDSPVGPGVARNLAAASARGTWIVFVDADVLVHPDAIHRLLAPLRKAGPDAAIAATIGSYDDRPEAPGIAATYANLRHHLVHQQARNPVPGFWTGLGAVRRDAFHSVGGFDAAFGRPSIEDVEFGLRLSAVERTIEVVPEANGTHLKAWTAIGLWKTDLFARGIPWGRAIATHPALASAMNGSPRARIAILSISISALSTVLAIVAGAAGLGLSAIAFGVVALVGLGAWVLVEQELFGLMARHRGRATAIGGLGFHAIHHLTVPAACLFGVMLGRWEGTVIDPVGSRRRVAWLLVAWLPMVVMILAAAMVTMAGPASIHDRLLDWEAGIRDMSVGRFQPRYDEAATARILSRLPVLLLPSLLFGVVISWFGPRRLEASMQDALSSLRETFRFRMGLGIATSLLAMILLLGILRTEVPMRTDEAATVMSHGLTNPLVIMGNYQTPNNHMLHSILVWTSIQCFGTEPWAVRLPAMLFCLACVPLIAAAAARLRGDLAGLLAAAMFVCLPSTLELGTNARGYPIVVACMLAMIAMLPMLARNRPGAGLGFAVAGAVGLMTVPIMAYPLGLLYSGLFIGRWRSGGFGEAMRCVPFALLTVLLAATWYLPAWIAAPGDGPLGTVSHHLPLIAGRDRALVDELGKAGYWIGKAWKQWSWPVPEGGSWLVTIPIVVSIAAGLVRGRAVGMLAAGILVGPALVLAITGFGAPPWWTMTWIPPVLIVALMAGFPWPFRPGRRGEAGEPVVSSTTPRGIILGGLVMIAAVSAIFWIPPERFRRDFPSRVWIGDAGTVAAWLIEQDIETGSVRANGVAHGPVNYELHRRTGLLRSVRIAKGPVDDSNLPVHLLTSTTSVDGSGDPDPRRFFGGRSDLELIDRRIVGEALVRTYDLPASR
ncbi:MAG: glycosyltransferase [Phycisphaera sp.]|nr:glycosyltransferase [Phycisphaera sp.]